MMLSENSPFRNVEIDMAATDDIQAKARELGKMIADHPVAKDFDAAGKTFDQDRDAQRVLVDFNRHLQTLAEKQSQGKPIEVEDKRKLQQLQQAVATNVQVRRLQTAQMNYLDLIRGVTTTILETAAPGGAAGSGDPLSMDAELPDAGPMFGAGLAGSGR